MSIDSFFTIGKSHKVCEDYAIFTPETNPTPLFGISDGCSSSIDTDIGSRILLKCLISTYQSGIKLNGEDYGVLWGKASEAVKILGLPLKCLDATLNFGYVTTLNNVEGVEVITIGDGFVVAQKHNGEFVIINIEFSQNAPYYLSYEFDRDRRDQFMILDQKKEITTKFVNANGQLSSEYLSSMAISMPSSQKITKSWFPFSEYKLVSVFSDGLKTFIPQDQTQPKLPLEQIVKELISFPQTNGEFVKRKCLRFLKNHPASYFYDDFSMATLIKE
jgi:hypothetical protein